MSFEHVSSTMNVRAYDRSISIQQLFECMYADHRRHLYASQLR